MAIDASPRRHGVRTSQVKAGLRVIELAIGPLDGVMALLTSSRETRVRHGSRGVVEIVLVARNAGRDRDVVVVVDVAVRALSWGHSMRAGQRKRSLRVVKRCRLPGDRGVALLARRREASLYVIRIRGSLEVLLMA